MGHQVTVLTRAANASAIERQPRPGLAFLYYDLPRWVQLCRKGAAGKRLYYVLWQWCAARHIRRRFPQLLFDVVQHVTYVSVRYPSFMGSLGIPFYFGPVSGGEKVPAKLRKSFSVGERCREGLRDWSNRLVPLDPLLRAAFRRAEKIIVTRDTLPMVPRAWLGKCHVRLAIGLTSDYLRQAAVTSQPTGRCVRLLYVGRLLEWKGIDIALRAVRHLQQWQMEVRFTIVGDGPARARLTRLAQHLELTEIVDWVGCIPQRDVEAHYRMTNLFLFPSLRDSGGMAALEAMAHGLPVVCTDLGGPGVTVNEDCGRVLPALHKTRDELATLCARAVLEVMDLPGLRKDLSAGAKARARDFEFHSLAESLYPSCRIPSAVENHEHNLSLSAAVLHDATVSAG